MEHKIKVAIEFGNINWEQRSDFFEALEKAKWQKHRYEESVWYIRFEGEYNYNRFKQELMEDLFIAKIKSRIPKLDFMIRIDKYDTIEAKL
jgi:hypothetical protein